MGDYWPSPQANDPANPPYVHEWARIWHPVPKVAFSNTLQSVSWNSRLVRGVTADEAARMKTLPGEDLEVGGGKLAASLIRHDLIDLCELFVQPVDLGSGTAFFPL